MEKKPSTNRYSAIIDLFQLVTPYKKPTSSNSNHTVGRKKLILFQWILTRLKMNRERKKERKKEIYEYIYAYLKIYMYIYIYIYIYVYEYVYTCEYLYSYLYAYISIYVHVYVNICTYT